MSEAPAMPLSDVAGEPPAVAVLRGFWEWIATGGCRIKSREGRLITLVPNQLQRDLYQAMLRQAYAGVPIRILILKSRKMGCSTFIEALGYYLVKHCPRIAALVLAHTDPSTRDIFDIAARMYVEDPEWGADKQAWPTAISFKDQHDSDLKVRTFGGMYALSGGNNQFVHLSELAKAQGDSAGVADQMLSVLGSVSDVPTTYVFIESTANRSDVSGEFERRCRESMAGRGSYAFVFSPWFDEPTYQTPGAGPLPPLEDDAERAAEEALVAAFPFLSDAQLRWRRNKIVDLGGLLKFQQEYPATPEEAFQVASGKVFPKLREKLHGWPQPGEHTPTPAELVEAGYTLYRGLDWGGADPFVMVGVAHQPRLRTRFTLDLAACPKLWEELTHWTYDERGRPRDKANHAIDALRYVVTYWGMTGHVHVFAEIYDPDFAAAGRWIANNAADVLAVCREWPDCGGTVADRSRPDCIAGFQNQGIPTVPYRIEGVSGRPGEILFGVDRLNELIVASHPIEYAPPAPTLEERRARRRLTAGVTFGYASREEAYAAEQEAAFAGEVPLGAGW